jgi:hypothetical protein
MVGPNVVDGGAVVATAATVASFAVAGEGLRAGNDETLLA